MAPTVLHFTENVLSLVEQERFLANGGLVICGGERVRSTTKYQMSGKSVAGLEIPHWFSQAGVLGITCVDDKLYAVGEYYDHDGCMEPLRSHYGIGRITKLRRLTRIECYDPDKNEWSKKTEFPDGCMGQAFSMRVFKGSEFLRKVLSPLTCHNPSKSESKNQEPLPDIEDKKKCLVM